MEMSSKIQQLAGANAANLVNFCGGGFYDHFILAAVDAPGRERSFHRLHPINPRFHKAHSGNL